MGVGVSLDRVGDRIWVSISESTHLDSARYVEASI